MSDQNAQNDTYDKEQQVRAYAHEIKNGLYVVQMGIEALKSVRSDAHQFEEVCNTIEQDGIEALRNATAELIRFVREEV